MARSSANRGYSMQVYLPWRVVSFARSSVLCEIEITEQRRDDPPCGTPLFPLTLSNYLSKCISGMDVGEHACSPAMIRHRPSASGRTDAVTEPRITVHRTHWLSVSTEPHLRGDASIGSGSKNEPRLHDKRASAPTSATIWTSCWTLSRDTSSGRPTFMSRNVAAIINSRARSSYRTEDRNDESSLSLL